MTNFLIKKAIIPAAGFGTRLFPTTKVFKKEFFPIIDRNGQAKPVILLIIEEALSAGVEEIGIIIQEHDRPLFEAFFKHSSRAELFAKLSLESQAFDNYLLEIGQKITFIPQAQPEGFGQAVFCAKDWIKDEPFLLFLGDHIYVSDQEVSCAKQLLSVYQQTKQSTIALTVMPGEIIHKAGIVKGHWQTPLSILTIDQLVEKPTLEYARSQLQTPGMNSDEFLAIFGIYILEPQIFDFLEAEIAQNLRYKNEFQLTTCLDKLRQDRGMTGYLVKGQYFDTGMPQFYRQTLIDFPPQF